MRFRRAPFLALALFLASAVVVHADKTDDFIKAEMKRQNIPGLSVAVVKDGRIVKAAGYGVAEIKSKTPAKPETVYKIASVSKQFIATGIMLLVQDGRIRLDDPISKYLEGTPPDWAEITLRHLLTHTSGLVREAPGFDPLRVQSDAALIATAYSVPLRFRPGEKFEYGNLGYYALAEVIHSVSGRPWSEYIMEKVFKPSGMNMTWTTDTKQAVPNRAQGYVDNDRLQNADEWLALRPSGAFLSTVLDLAKWDAMLYKSDVLTADTKRQMWTPAQTKDGTRQPYGFGWQLSLRGRTSVYHSGGMPGARAHFGRYVDDRVTVILLMNLDDVDIDSIVHGVAELYLPEN